MRIALYIDEGREQVVLTPESKTEKNILEKLTDGTRSIGIYRGEFYACTGGWTRHSNYAGPHDSDGDLNSTIIVLEPATDEKSCPDE